MAYAGEHLLDLLDRRVAAADLGIHTYEKNEIDEIRRARDNLSSSNSSISYQRTAPVSDPEKGLAPLPPEVVEGLGLLLTMPAPRDFPPAHWSKAVKQAIRFAADWAAVALRLGWSVEELFGLHPLAPYARHDAKGLAFAPSDDKCIVAITENSAAIRTGGGANLTFYRRPHLEHATLAWELGDGSGVSKIADGR